MQDIVIKITADTSGIQSTIDMLKKMNVISDEVFDAYTKNVEHNSQAIKKNVDSTAKSFDKLNQSLKNAGTENNLAKNLDASAAVVKTANSLTSLKAQLSAVTKEAQMLTDKYGELDKRTLAAASRASELRQKIEDTGRVIKALDPGEKFNTIKNFAAAIGGAFQVATGALQAFGVENEKAQKIAQQFQGALNIAAGLGQLVELKDTYRDLKVALGLATVATEAKTTVQEVDNKVTEEGVVANEAFAASLSATGIGAIVVVLGTLVAAMISYSNATAEADKANAILQSSRDKAIDSVSVEATKLKILESEYNRHNISQAKKKELSDQMIAIAPDLASAFTKEGEAIGGTTSAVDKYITARLKQAQADAIVGEIAKLNAENEKLRATGGTELISVWDKATTIIGEAVTGIFRFDQASKLASTGTHLVKTAQVELNQQVKENNSVIDKLTGKLEELQNAGAKIADPTKGAGGDKDKKTPFELAVERVKGSYEKLRAEESKAFGTLYTDNLLFDERIAALNRKQTTDLIAVYRKFNKDASSLITDLNKPDEGGIKPIEKKINIEAIFPTDKDQEAFDMTINPATVPQRTGGVTIPVHVETPEELAVGKEVDKLKTQLNDQLISGAEDVANKWIAVWQDAQLQVDQARIDSLDQETKDLDEQYNRKLIGRVEYDAKVAALDQKKREAERKLKHDQDIADRNKALFNVAINTATSIAKSFAEFGPAATATVPYLLGIGAAQAAAILASPLPKYKKGTLSVPGVGSEDTQLAMLTPGEAVIPKDTNQRYKDSIAAIYHGKISPNELNSFVRMKLKGDYSANSGPLTAKMDTSDLYALGKMIKKNDGVYVKNLGDFAAILADMNNPRR